MPFNAFLPVPGMF